MRILYGANDTYVDVTESIGSPSVYVVPISDAERASQFGTDPLLGHVKNVIIEDDFQKRVVVPIENICCVVKDEGAYRIVDYKDVWTVISRNPDIPAETKLAFLHMRLRLYDGHFHEEYHEQYMAMIYVQPNSRVLELGGNIGRNSCVIGSILEDSSNLVVLESDPNIAQKLVQNRNLNSLKFQVIPAALSKRRLIQKDWDTRPLLDNNPIPEGWSEISTITLNQLTLNREPFDTLVADCEGALYYILHDEPHFFDSFHTVILENDYLDISHKEYVDDGMKRSGLKLVYQKPGPWGPCHNRFYEVWQK